MMEWARVEIYFPKVLKYMGARESEQEKKKKHCKFLSQTFLFLCMSLYVVSCALLFAFYVSKYSMLYSILVFIHLVCFIWVADVVVNRPSAYFQLSINMIKDTKKIDAFRGHIGEGGIGATTRGVFMSLSMLFLQKIYLVRVEHWKRS